MKADLVCNALNKAVEDKRPSQGLIVHSDKGSQYYSEAINSIVKYIEVDYN